MCHGLAAKRLSELFTVNLLKMARRPNSSSENQMKNYEPNPPKLDQKRIISDQTKQLTAKINALGKGETLKHALYLQKKTKDQTRRTAIAKLLKRASYS
jgi:hypothetical protein